jgi:exo-beta-1,3-glucanase (GH17 family)
MTAAVRPRWLDQAWLGRAICYSGYREGQSPDSQVFPSAEQVREDLLLLARHWRLLRLYDCSMHAELVLDVIRRERLDLKVLLGAWLAAEADNPACPWGGIHGAARLALNVAENRRELDRLVVLANRFPEVVVAVSAGNEACVDWTDHLVPPARVLGYVRELKRQLKQPVTFCENYVPWQAQLAGLAAEVDFISIHTYPAWEAKPPAEAMAYTVENWRSVADRHPGTPVIVTEAGWTTRSGGRGVRAEHATLANQVIYLEALDAWSRERGILTFVFEAFDEPWKGASDPLEPEKHWGLFTVDRRPKPAAPRLFQDPAPTGVSS